MNRPRARDGFATSRWEPEGRVRVAITVDTAFARHVALLRLDSDVRHAQKNDAPRRGHRQEKRRDANLRPSPRDGQRRPLVLEATDERVNVGREEQKDVAGGENRQQRRKDRANDLCGGADGWTGRGTAAAATWIFRGGCDPALVTARSSRGRDPPDRGVGGNRKDAHDQPARRRREFQKVDAYPARLPAPSRRVGGHVDT